MFNRKNSTSSCPIKLPVVEANVTDDAIMAMLEDGTPIYAWYTMDKPSYAAVESFTGRNIEGLMMFRRELDYLCTYVSHFIDGVMIFRLYAVSMMSPENVTALINERLTTATTVMYDDSGLTEYQQTFSHDIDDAMVREALKSRKTWIIGDEHFHKI